MSFNNTIDNLLTTLASNTSDEVERALQVYDVNDIVSVVVKRLLDAEGVGGGGSITPPLDLTQTDDTQPELILQGAPGATTAATPALLVKDDAGAAAADIDSDGTFASYDLSNPFQASGVQLSRRGTLHLTADPARVGSGQVLFQMQYGTFGVFSFVAPGAGFAAIIAVQDPDDVPLQVQAASGQTVDLFQGYDAGFNLTFRLDKGGRAVIANHTAPADGDLVAGECAIWFDQTDGAAKVMAKAKTADGTVVTGNLGSLT